MAQKNVNESTIIENEALLGAVIGGAAEVVDQIILARPDLTEFLLGLRSGKLQPPVGGIRRA